MTDRIGLIKRPPEIDVRRTLHFKLLPDTHAALRVLCVKEGISMQEFFEELAQLMVVDDSRLRGILRDLVKKKRQRYYEKLSVTDAESLFDILEEESAWQDD